MTVLLVGTRKGAWFLRSDATRTAWRIEGPTLLGSTVHHVVSDPRDPNSILLAARTGHLGPTVFRSSDRGQTWTEASAPPAFKKVEADSGARARSVNHVFWLTPGHASEPSVWYAGSSPQGLFRTDDGGDTWTEVVGFNDHPDLDRWTGGEKDGTPDGPKLHSVIVDPADPAHLLIGMSSGGIFESLDRGATWSPLNKGVAMDFAPPKEDGSEYAFGHDPHCVVMHPADSTRLYQQNHCGIYRLDRGGDDRWVRIGDNMPKEVGDVGFPIVVHPRQRDMAWVFPMDGSTVWPRVSPGGQPAVFMTPDAGETWHRQANGFPAEQGWWTVKRQCFAADGHDPVGLYLGTTAGQLWASADEGERWTRLPGDLPHVYSVEVAAFD